MRSIRLALISAGVLVAAGAGPARAETTICTTISALPYTITAQGSYCLDRNLSSNSTTGAAITINTNFVVLDLNGFKIGGGGAGVNTSAIGVRAVDKTNITVKNGNIRGFKRAVSLEENTGVSQAHLVEDIRADENTEAGLWVEGDGNVIRNNAVVSTPGTAALGGISGDRATYGIYSNGAGARIINNDSTDTIGIGTADGTGIFATGADGVVIENNRVGNAALDTDSFGILLGTGDDVLVVGNRIATVDTALSFGSATGKYRDNITSGVNTDYTGGTDAGNNQ